jgi:aspartyl-tRNA(Asn)/glutamyl-tRNA(Gln) amidotransferase subunit A
MRQGAVARVEALLARIGRLNPELCAFITVTEKAALDAARACDAAAADGRSLGPLHGLVVAVKDCIDIAGTRGTWGSAFFAERIATADSVAVARLRAAGAILIGTTNLHEFAYGGTTQNPHYGSCRNAWDRKRVPGGSSGGSAVAVATGLCDVALGTDTGASIRLPAALNGIAGLRPTIGAVPNLGCMPVSPPYDVIGPMAYEVAQLARVLEVMRGYAPGDPFSRHPPPPGPDAAGNAEKPLSGLRIAMPRGYFRDGVDADAVAALEAAAAVLESQGAGLVDIDLPLASQAQEHLNPIIYADAANFHRERLKRSPEMFGRAVRERLQPGLTLPAVDYARGLRWIERFRLVVQRFFDDAADVVLLPAVTGPAPLISEHEDAIAVTASLSRFFWVAPAGGLPALALPCGFSSQNLPLGLQLLGPPWSDDRLLAIGRHYQAATDWHRRRPGLPEACT